MSGVTIIVTEQLPQVQQHDAALGEPAAWSMQLQKHGAHTRRRPPQRRADDQRRARTEARTTAWHFHDDACIMTMSASGDMHGRRNLAAQCSIVCLYHHSAGC